MSVTVVVGDCRKALGAMAAKSVHTCVTSPPYFGLRDYQVAGQIGLESTPDCGLRQRVRIRRAMPACSPPFARVARCGHIPRMAARTPMEVHADEDGALTPTSAEMLAQNMAEGMSVQEGWKATGKVNAQWDLTLRKEFEASLVFQTRVAVLKAERLRLLQDPIWGQPTWMVNQLFRHAVACKDVKMMAEAAGYRIKIAGAVQSLLPPPEVVPDATPETPKRAVGKPAAANPQAMGRNTSQIRDKLMGLGVAVPDEE